MATSATTIPEEAKPIEKAQEQASSLWMTLLPYCLAIGAQLPLLFLYFRTLSAKAHYAFFPFAFLAVALLVWMRWPKDSEQRFVESWFSNVLLFVGLAAGLLGVLFVEPWFAAFSVMILITSLLARTRDSDTDHSMWTSALPMFSALLLPYGSDMKLIIWLQRVSAHLTSRLLDVLQYGHYMPGTKIQMPGVDGIKEYGVEQMCSGVQSFFTLLFVALAFVVWMRRPWFRSILLMLSAVFWAIFMNTVRILLIPVFDVTLGINLSEGVSHAVLGYITLGIGILLLFSTDQFLMFMFGPVEPSSGNAGPFGRFFTYVWNSLIAGDENADVKRRKRRLPPLTTISRILAWVVAVPLVIAGVWSLVDVQQSFASGKKVRFFQGNVIYPLTRNSLPEDLDGWEMVDYVSEFRKRSSDLGERSDAWIYRAPNGNRATVSFDQTFPGWHELTSCYLGDGWQVAPGGRIRKPAEFVDEDGNTKPWAYIEVSLSKPTGEKGLLLFSLFDAFGEPFLAPAEWGTPTAFINGVQNRMNNRIRARLFQSEGYQTQVFVGDYQDFSPEARDEITDRYLKFREQMRKEFLRSKEAGGLAPSEPDEDATADATE